MVYRIQPAKAPFNPNMAVAQIAMQDTAAFHAFLAIIAACRSSPGESSLQSETMYHKGESIRIVKERLKDHDNLSDGTIYAVLWLWTLDVCSPMPFASLSNVCGHSRCSPRPRRPKLTWTASKG
jgi:hypothetical protein